MARSHLRSAFGLTLASAATMLRQAGSGPDRTRQEGSHAHAIVLDAAERFALAADLGADRIFVDRFPLAPPRR